MNPKLISQCFLIFSFLGFGFTFDISQNEWTNLFSRENSPEFLRRLSFENISQQCSDHTQAFQKKLTENPIAGLNDGFWELKMLDSWGKLPEGVFSGNTKFLGSYSSCLDVNVQPHQHNGTNIEGFQGRYITLMLGQDMEKEKTIGRMGRKVHPAQTWKIPMLEKKSMEKSAGFLGGLFLYASLCLPSTCSEKEITSGIQSIIDNSEQTSGLGIVVTLVSSNSNADSWNLDGVDIFMIVLIVLIAIMIITGTALEIAMLYKITEYGNKSTLGALLIGFSAYKNTKVLFATSGQNRTGKSEILHCLNGIRFISMTWVVIGHVFTNVAATPSNNFSFYLMKIGASYAFQAVINAFPSVDTFFLLSGCLVTYLTLKELDKTNGRMNWVMFYVHRYLRLTGIYAFVVLFHMTLFRGFKGGTIDNVPSLVDGCRETWWRNLLYITNFFSDVEVSCLGQTWYLDNDMQMFLVAPLIIYPIWRLKKWGLLMASLWVIASAAVPYGLTIKKEWPATTVLETGGTDFFQHNYIVPWCRFSPYVCGILLGYALHLTKGKPFKMPKELNILCWISAFITGYMVIYGLNLPEVFVGNSPPKAALDIYGGFHRLAWGMAVSWVIFACCRGYGGWINSFLSWEAFEPLAKLSYNIYLVHFSVIYVLSARDSFTAAISNMLVVMRILNVLVFSTFAAIILFVGVEVPWANTEKWIFSMILPKTKKT